MDPYLTTKNNTATPYGRGRNDSAPAPAGRDRVGEAMLYGADGWLGHIQPFCRALQVLLLQDRYGDGDLRTDHPQPFNIWMNDIKSLMD